jgi:hypothetical protein
MCHRRARDRGATTARPAGLRQVHILLIAQIESLCFSFGFAGFGLEIPLTIGTIALLKIQIQPYTSKEGGNDPAWVLLSAPVKS